MMKRVALKLLFLLSVQHVIATTRLIIQPEVISEPYPFLNSGSFSAPSVPDSFDPLISYRWNTNVNTTELQVYYLAPVQVISSNTSSFVNLSSLLANDPHVEVVGEGSIMVDFGVESAAWLEFDSPDLVLSNNIQMSISEYNQPGIVNAGPPNPIKTGVPVQYNRTFRLELNPQLYEGVRFGWIQVSGAVSPWHITAVRAVCQIKPTNYTGSFQTSSSLINKIWYTAAYTVKVNLMSDYFGSILMDRGDRYSWTGDAHTAQACALVAFSNYDFIAQNLNRTSTQSNGIESYSLYWVLSVLDYFWYTGDVETFNTYIPNVEAKISHALSILGTNPSLGFFGHDVRTGAAFENASCTENQNAYSMLVLRILNEYSYALGVLNMTTLQKTYVDTYNALVLKLRTGNSDWYADFGMHACAEAINANFTTTEEQDAIYAKVFSDPIQLVSYTPFNQYYIVTALGRMGQMETALQATVLNWGGQLALGATTFWEVYSSQWNSFMNPLDPPVNGPNGYTSMCHPWAGGITRWLSENILGVRPTSPGFSKYTVTPYISQVYNLTTIAGVVETPNGPISVSYDFDMGIMTLSAPEGTVGRIGIPKNGHEITKISTNSEVIYYNSALIPNVDEDAQYIYVNGVPSGTHTYFIAYSLVRSTEEIQKAQVETYAASYLGNDTETQGNWLTKYGNAGYYLFDYSQSKSDVSSLPSFVDSLTWNTVLGVGNPRFLQFVSATSDIRALQSPNRTDTSRALGAMATQDPGACMQTVHINILLKQPTSYYLTIYVVDYDAEEREMVLQFYDGETVSIIAPHILVRDFNNGIYYRYQYDQSAQVRVMQVRGGDAVISGIFFDT